MRLVFDLFPCQTGSRFRGIGRFTQSLAEAMARLRGQHDMYALANGMQPESADYLRQEVGAVLPKGHFSCYTHTERASFDTERTHHAVSSALIQRAYQSLAPDAILYSTPFEGWGEIGIVPLPHGSVPDALRVTVLYDFIPYLFPEHYFVHTPGYKEWWLRRLAALHQFDLLLTISESTRHDAIEILGISPERVVNISGAASPMFRTIAPHEQAQTDISRFGIVRPFVLYTGNVDYRKNQDGMLQAYAALPAAVRQEHQLVLNQVGDMHAFRNRMRSLDLHADEVVVTGHITDQELIALYGRCKLFVFPSLYEGFGLPILEAMSCGAPVIAGRNSSIPEVVGRDDVLFDAARPEAIRDAMLKVLTDDRLRAELAVYGPERARFFSWERSAKLAWEAIENNLAAKKAAAQVLLPKLPKPRIAVVCSLHAQDSAATLHCIGILPHLARHVEIDLFAEDGPHTDIPLRQTAIDIYPQSQLTARRDRYATVLYQLANTGHHAFMLPLLEEIPGVVALHDIRLDAPLKALAARPEMELAFENEIFETHGLQGLIAWLKQTGNVHGMGQAARNGSGEESPVEPGPAGLRPAVNRHVLELAQYLVVPEAVHSGLLAQLGPDAWLPPVAVLPAKDDTKSCVASYMEAIHAAIARDESHTVAELADALENTAAGNNALNEIARHAASNWRLRKHPRLLVDVTQLAKTDARSGIQRVVRNIARELCNIGELDRQIEVVRQEGGRLFRATHVIAAIFGVDEDRIPAREISIQPGDTLVMIDSSWEQYASFLPIFQSVRQLGGKIVSVVYDLIPLRSPQFCAAPLVNVFRQWFGLAADHSDMLLCISHAVANDVAAYLAEQKHKPPRKLDIRYWPLGADIAVGGRETGIREQVIRMTADRKTPLFLIVGTVEPRKGHEFVLDAFESLWRKGLDFRLCIAGGEGWRVAETMKRIRQHPQLNKKLFFVEKFTDAEINLCYSAATALVAASVAEGYGLPIVEAGLHGVAVLASDIPVFREVGGDGARYFSLEGPQHLADAVEGFAALPAEERTKMAAQIKTYTWHESACEFAAAIGCLA